GRHPHIPDRRHGAAAESPHIIRAFVVSHVVSAFARLRSWRATAAPPKRRWREGGQAFQACRAGQATLKGRATHDAKSGVIVIVQKFLGRLIVPALITLALAASTTPLVAQTERAAGGEANLVLPDLSVVEFGGVNARTLLMGGLVVCALGLGFGLVSFTRLKNLPVHRSMREVSELIYETCKTYLTTQGKFILVLWGFIAVVIAAYFGWLSPVEGKPVAVTVPVILLFSLIGIAGSYGVAWFGIRVNTFANSRAAFASLRGKPYPVYAIPLRSGMSVGMLLISVELFMMLCILLFIPGD